MITTATLILVTIVLFLAAFTHGILTFGFPVVATPLVALFLDIKLAVIITVIPNLLLNVIYAVKEGPWPAYARKYWYMIILVLIGTIFGSHALLSLPQNVLKLLLVLMIAAYLLQEQVEHLDFLKRFCRLPIAAPIFGLLGGFFSGAVNVSSVPLVIYFASQGISPILMSQVLNASFAAGKVTQFLLLTWAGAMKEVQPFLLLFFSVISVIGLVLGMFAQKRLSASTHKRMIKLTLAFVGLLLLFQVIFE